MFNTLNGRYQLHEKLGQGGMGVVYRAIDRLTGDTVALKQVHLASKLQVGDSLMPGATEDDLRLALAHEFQILAGLRHPHIISVLDYGFDEERKPFFTMTYLPESQNILDAAQDAPFDQKIELIQQLLQALAYLHRRGVLHRDLKPDNVLVVEGSVKVLDFGLSASDQVSSSASVGTPLYMAPELFNGEGYSEMADLYAVGILLCQLMIGEHPFAPFDYSFLDRLLEAAPNLSRIDKRLRPFLTNLFTKTPTNRYQTAVETMIALADATDTSIPKETADIRESYLQAAIFVGRGQELAQLTTAVQQAKNGAGSGWLIGGESGAGKSRLMRELETNALVAGFVVLRGQAINQGGLPYQLLREPIRHLLVSSPYVDDFIASTLKFIVPDVEQLIGRTAPDPPSVEEKQQNKRLINAILRLFRQNGHPILLLLEDLQWTNESLVIVSQLTALAETNAMLIVGSYRINEWPTLPEAVAKMNQIVLERFNEDETAAFAQAMLGSLGASDKLVKMLQRETEGNAFFLVEIVRTLAERAGQLIHIDEHDLPENLLPNGIHTIIQQWLSKIGSHDKQLLQLAAIAGRQLDLEIIEALKAQHDIGQISLEQWLTKDNLASVLMVQDDRWLFAHDKIREGLLADISQAEWQPMHAAVATALEMKVGAMDDYAGRIASLWQEAKEPEKERPYLLRAGLLAAAQFHNSEAQSLYARALSLTPADNLADRLDILLAQARLFFVRGLHKEQAELLDRMRELAEELADANYLTEVYLRQIVYDFSIGAIAQTVKNSQKTLHYATQSDNRRALGIAYRLLGSVDVATGEIDSAITSFEHSLQINLQNENPYEVANSRMILGGTCGTYGRYRQAQSLLNDAIAYFRKFEIKNLESVCASYRAIFYARIGEIEKAVVDAERCNELAQATEDRMASDLAPSTLSQVAAYQEKFDEAWVYSTQAVAIMRQNNNLFYLSIALQDRAEIAIRLDAWTDAQTAYQDALDIGELFQDRLTRLACQAGLARTASMLNQPNELLIQPILAYLEESFDLNNLRYPIAFCLNIYYAMRETHPVQATLAIQQGYQLLQTRAEQFSSAAEKNVYLHQSFWHRELLALYQRQKNTDPKGR